MKSSPRGAARVRLAAVHTTEGVMKVADLRAFFDRPSAAGSSHAGADRTGKLAGPEGGFVPYDRAAWTLRNGNPISDNLEYCGFARYTRAQWLDLEARGLEAIAQWLADRHKARGVPLVKLSPADVAAGKSGVIGHNDWTVGMRDGSHWDPGPGFPWDTVLVRARQIAGQTIPGVPALPFPVVGSIAGTYHKVIYPPNMRWSFVLGLPVGPEVPTLNKVGRWQAFQNGAIYWHPQHTEGIGRVVMGAILERWREEGLEFTTGYPITDEMACGADLKGRFNRFANGWMIYWSAATGAQPVHGAFLAEWSNQGYERGPLGYPTTGEYEAGEDGETVMQNFQHGRLVLRPGYVETIRT